MTVRILQYFVNISLSSLKMRTYITLYSTKELVKCCSVHCFNVWLDTIKGSENQPLDLFYSAKLY